MILIVNNGSMTLPHLKKYLKSRNVRFVIAQKNTRLKKLMKHRFKGVILTGGPLCYDRKINIEDVTIDFAVIADMNVPVLGICFGHQTLAEIFDGRIKKLPRVVTGCGKIKISKKCRLFLGLGNELDMVEHHKDTVAEIPYNFIQIARSKTGIEGMKHKTKPIYGIQFHPEASGETGWKLLDNFMKICKINVRK